MAVDDDARMKIGKSKKLSMVAQINQRVIESTGGGDDENSADRLTAAINSLIQQTNEGWIFRGLFIKNKNRIFPR